MLQVWPPSPQALSYHVPGPGDMRSITASPHGLSPSGTLGEGGQHWATGWQPSELCFATLLVFCYKIKICTLT